MTEIKSYYCIFNECKEQAKFRGLCIKHYSYYIILVRAVKTTWEELENKGLVLKRSGKGGKKNCTTKCLINNCNRYGTTKSKLCSKCCNNINTKIENINDLKQIKKFLEDNKLTNIEIKNCYICNRTSIYKGACCLCRRNLIKNKVSNKCFYKECNNKILSRNLCSKHYNICRRSIQNNETTWEELEKEGLALKSKKRKLD